MKLNEWSEDEPDLHEAQILAMHLARSAGKTVLEMRKEGALAAKGKSAAIGDVVTAADRASEKMIVDGIRARYSRHSIRGEEETNIVMHQSPYEWIIDPIDGTLNFTKHRPFSVSIGLVKQGAPLLGVLYFPDDDVLLSAIKGEGTMRNGQHIHRRTTVPFSQARIEIDVSAKGKDEEELARFRDPVRPDALRPFCCTSAARRIIEGDLDAYICGGLTPYDLAAEIIILQEAGCSAEGIFERIDLSKAQNPFISASDAALVEEIRRRITCGTRN